MSKTAMIRARITPELKETAESILKKLGITSTEAISIFYTQIVIQKAIPFDVRLESGDKKQHYTKVKSAKHLRQLIDD